VDLFPAFALLVRAASHQEVPHFRLEEFLPGGARFVEAEEELLCA